MESFVIEVGDGELADLRARIRNTRWPEAETDPSQGVPLGYLCDYWAGAYDWRAAEARLNAFPQIRADIDGVGIHAIHARSPYPEALPLVMTHGWPGSVLEFTKVIGPLTEAGFHVVCPSPPGYGFSGKPDKPGWGIERIARAWARLMAELGYDRYGAQGSDWGSSISTCLALQDPEHVVGIHLTPPLAAPFGDPTPRGAGGAAHPRTAAADRERLLRHPGDQAADHRLRPGRLPRRAVRVDRGEAAGLERRRRLHPRRPARYGHPLLADRHGSLVGAPVLGEHPPGHPLVQRRPPGHGRRAGRRLDLSQGGAEAVTPLGRQALHRHPPLERAARRRSLRRLRAARDVREGGQRLLQPNAALSSSSTWRFQSRLTSRQPSSSTPCRQ